MNDQCLLGQACAAEEKAGPINMNNSAQKANSNLFDIGYDKIAWGTDSPVILGQDWYGYRHVNGTLHVKRMFTTGDFKEASASDFVLYTIGPFQAKNKVDAMSQVQGILRKFHQDGHKLFSGEVV